MSFRTPSMKKCVSKRQLQSASDLTKRRLKLLMSITSVSSPPTNFKNGQELDSAVQVENNNMLSGDGWSVADLTKRATDLWNKLNKGRSHLLNKGRHLLNKGSHLLFKGAGWFNKTPVGSWCNEQAKRGTQVHERMMRMIKKAVTGVTQANEQMMIKKKPIGSCNEEVEKETEPNERKQRTTIKKPIESGPNEEVEKGTEPNERKQRTTTKKTPIESWCNEQQLERLKEANERMMTKMEPAESWFNEQQVERLKEANERMMTKKAPIMLWGNKQAEMEIEANERMRQITQKAPILETPINKRMMKIIKETPIGAWCSEQLERGAQANEQMKRMIKKIVSPKDYGVESLNLAYDLITRRDRTASDTANLRELLDDKKITGVAAQKFLQDAIKDADEETFVSVILNLGRHPVKKQEVCLYAVSHLLTAEGKRKKNVYENVARVFKTFDPMYWNKNGTSGEFKQCAVTMKALLQFELPEESNDAVKFLKKEILGIYS